jgi:hypothetical protein
VRIYITKVVVRGNSGFSGKIGSVTRMTRTQMGDMFEVTFDKPTENNITSSLFFENELEDLI